jgi:hypothetical protein
VIVVVYSSFTFLVAVGMNTADTMDTKEKPILGVLGVN